MTRCLDLSSPSPAVLGTRAPVGGLDESLTGRVVEGLADDVMALKAEVAQLRQAAATRAPIEQAKGIMMHRYSLGAKAPSQLLRRWPAETNVKLREVAQILVEMVVEGSPPEDADPAVVDLIGAATASPAERA